MMGKFPEVLNFNRLFLKPNWFIYNWRSVLPIHCSLYLQHPHLAEIGQPYILQSAVNLLSMLFENLS